MFGGKVGLERVDRRTGPEEAANWQQLKKNPQAKMGAGCASAEAASMRRGARDCGRSSIPQRDAAEIKEGQPTRGHVTRQLPHMRPSTEGAKMTKTKETNRPSRSGLLDSSVRKHGGRSVVAEDRQGEAEEGNMGNVMGANADPRNSPPPRCRPPRTAEGKGKGGTGGMESYRGRSGLSTDPPVVALRLGQGAVEVVVRLRWNTGGHLVAKKADPIWISA